MLRGRFGNTSGAPYLEAHIFLPRLKLRGLVSFLVDTGADGTVLMPADAKRLGVKFKSLKNPTVSEGIGGEARGFNEKAILAFSDAQYVYSYLLDIELSTPAKHNLRFPSLLGRDVLDKWRCVLERSRRIATFNPRVWDFRQKV